MKGHRKEILEYAYLIEKQAVVGNCVIVLIFCMLWEFCGRVAKGTPKGYPLIMPRYLCRRRCLIYAEPSFVALLSLKFGDPFSQFVLQQCLVGQVQRVLLGVDIGFFWQGQFDQ